jgi:hypothetical protein
LIICIRTYSTNLHLNIYKLIYVDIGDGGVFEIREFVDSNGREINHEIVNLQKEMKDINEKMAHLKKNENEKNENGKHGVSKLNEFMSDVEEMSRKKVGDTDYKEKTYKHPSKNKGENEEEGRTVTYI